MDASDQTFSNDRMFQAFKRIRNRIGKYRPLDIAMKAMEMLNTVETDQSRIGRYPPHFLALLIKWSFLHGNYCSANYRTLTPRDFNDIVNLVHAFDEAARPPSDFGSLQRFIKTISHQQFYLQWCATKAGWVKPVLLFEALNRSGYAEQSFQKLTALSIPVFTDLSIITSAFFVNAKGPTRITRHNFHEIRDIEPAQISAFLRALSLRPEEVRTFLERVAPKRCSWDYELHEEFPLRRKPLLEVNGFFYPYSRGLLSYSLEHFVYDTLREDSPERFMSEFGSVFESYVGLGIADSKLPYFTERELRGLIRRGNKIVDYVLIAGDTNVLVDAKGVEMHRLGRVSHLGEVVEGKLKSSVISAIEQGNETVAALRLLNPENEVKFGAGSSFLLVVTYKGMYVGNGADLMEIIGQDRAASLVQKIGNPPLIPWNHIYYLSADEFDLLMGAVQHGADLGTILQSAARADAVPTTKVWCFGNHLKNLMLDKHYPRHVEEVFEQIPLRLAKHLRPLNCG